MTSPQDQAGWRRLSGELTPGAMVPSIVMIHTSGDTDLLRSDGVAGE